MSVNDTLAKTKNDSIKSLRKLASLDRHLEIRYGGKKYDEYWKLTTMRPHRVASNQARFIFYMDRILENIE